MKVIGKYVCLQCEKEITIEETHVAPKRKQGLIEGQEVEFSTLCGPECEEAFLAIRKKEMDKRRKRRESRKRKPDVKKS